MTERQQKELDRLELWRHFGYAVLFMAAILAWIALMHALFGPEDYGSPGDSIYW